MRLEPNDEVNYTNLGADYVSLNRLDEAEAVYKQAESANWRASPCSRTATSWLF